MRKLDSEDRAGLYITVIFHLVVLIILLVAQIGTILRKDNSFVIDFSKQEEVEQIKKELALKEEIARKLDDIISAYESTPVRNIAVDRGSTLKDDRNTDAEQLYKDAERLQQELNAGVQQNEDDDFVATPVNKPKAKEVTKKKEYSGPSVVSYELDGRKASHLSIPAYRCMGAGMVTVIITVNPQGQVINAKIEDGVSSGDRCLRDFAIRAARLSKFTVSPSAPAKQIGNIVYAFIAQ